MKTPVSGGDLVEELIYEAYKDKNLLSARIFKETIEKDYGFKPSSDLYTKIINYQIEKYGGAIHPVSEPYDKWFKTKTRSIRRKQIEGHNRRYETKKVIERIEKIEKNKRQELVDDKDTKTNIN